MKKQYMEGLVLIGKIRIWKNQDKEAQHHTHYITKPLVQENKYIVNNIKYMPMHFIKIYSS